MKKIVPWYKNLTLILGLIGATTMGYPAISAAVKSGDDVMVVGAIGAYLITIVRIFKDPNDPSLLPRK